MSRGEQARNGKRRASEIDARSANATVAPKSARRGRPRRDAEDDVASTSWLAEMKLAIRDPVELAARLGLPEALLAGATAGAVDFPLFVPRPYLARIEPGNVHDPLLRQVWPLADERQAVPGYGVDPVADLAAQQPAGVIRKYAGRALLIASGACAIHCRYCFRRHFPYALAPHAVKQWRPVIADLAQDPSLHEVILSGGDPLSLRDELLGELWAMIADCPHVKRLRIHTRLPIVIPQRVTPTLVRLVRDSRPRTVVVVHVNHPRELDEPVQAALDQLRRAGAILLNQAVLLRGVNDQLATLVALSERLAECHVLPYYLHQLDRVAGAAHFEVPIAEGQRLLAELQTRLPGYLVPRYVRDTPGCDSKEGLALGASRCD